jgi:hypothetical protein
MKYLIVFHLSSGLLLLNLFCWRRWLATGVKYFLEGLSVLKQKEVWGNSRSVMPLDVLECTRVTIEKEKSIHWCRASVRHHKPIMRMNGRCVSARRPMGNLWNLFTNWDRWLQFFILNEEYLVNATHQVALTTSLAFVHTARRFYRLMVEVRFWDGECPAVYSAAVRATEQWSYTPKLARILIIRGRRSRNKVAVGEPAAGSLRITIFSHLIENCL